MSSVLSLPTVVALMSSVSSYKYDAAEWALIVADHILFHLCW